MTDFPEDLPENYILVHKLISREDLLAEILVSLKIVWEDDEYRHWQADHSLVSVFIVNYDDSRYKRYKRYKGSINSEYLSAYSAGDSLREAVSKAIDELFRKEEIKWP